jgi:hypothetical protein
VLVARYDVEGEQPYTCTSSVLDVGGLGESITYAWMPGFSRGELHGGCTIAGSELGPRWTSSDGSSLSADLVASVPSPDAGAIPWSLYRVASSSGHGLLEDVAAIQRIETQGGAIPVEPCGPKNVRAERSVPFTATDYFYRGK